MRILSLCLSLLAFITVIGSGSAHAASLNELRASGVIGERYTGYAVVRKNKSGATGIVEKVNTTRRSIYKKRAAQQKIPAAQVGAIYAKQIYDNAPAGTWFQSQDGSWRRK